MITIASLNIEGLRSIDDIVAIDDFEKLSKISELMNDAIGYLPDFKNVYDWQSIFGKEIGDAIDAHWKKVVYAKYGDPEENEKKRLAEILATPVVIDGKTYMREWSFNVFHHAWECDETIWIAKDEAGKKAVIATNHGGFILADRKLIDDQIAQADEHISEMKKALRILSE